ncbi:MAG: FHA domain-containing protein, partial [Pseudoclavibacter sp.]|nr:FHA domain-containing protein [Pseudoclavibacter sp.]
QPVEAPESAERPEPRAQSGTQPEPVSEPEARPEPEAPAQAEPLAEPAVAPDRPVADPVSEWALDDAPVDEEADFAPDESTFTRWSSAARRAVRLSTASAERSSLVDVPVDELDTTLKGGIAKILREAARRNAEEAPGRSTAIRGAQPTVPMQPADFVEMFGDMPRPRSAHGRSAAAARSAGARQAAADSWGAPSAPAAEPEVQATLEFAGGDSVPVRVPIIIGRSPNQGPQRPGEPHPQWVKVVGSTDISRNHARVEVSAGLVLVTDLHSRNGTDIVLPERSPERLRPGEPTVVVPGTVIDLGSGVAFTVRS